MVRRLARSRSCPTRAVTEPPEARADDRRRCRRARPALVCPDRRPHARLGGPRRRHRSQRLLANRAVRDALVSLAGIVGRPVRNQGGAEIGRLADVVCRWTGEQTYPPVTGLVVRVGRRLAFVGAVAIDTDRAHTGSC